MIRYLKLNKKNISIEFCDKDKFEDVICEEIGYNFGSRTSINNNYIVIEDNCLEGEAFEINKNIYEKGILFGNCFITRRNYESLTDEDIKYLLNEIQTIT